MMARRGCHHYSILIISIWEGDVVMSIENGNIDIEGGQRKELVCHDDIARIAKMNKEDLNVYAHSRLDKKLDLTRRINNLRLDVITMVKKELKLPSINNEENTKTDTDQPIKEKARFVYEPKRQRVLEATNMLLKRTDLIPCWLVDKDGRKL